MKIKDKLHTVVCFCCAALFSLAAGAEEDLFLNLPGQTGNPAAEKPKTPLTHVTPAALRHPWIQLYYVEPTVWAGEKAKINYYVTDFDHVKVRFDDASKRFQVTLGISSDGITFKEHVQKGVPSGDGVFEVAGLVRGDYVARLSCVDETGCSSRVVWFDFRVRTNEEMTISAAQTERPTLADLAAAGVLPDPASFYHIEPVDVPDGVEFPVGIYEQIALNRKENKAKKEQIFATISNVVSHAIASPRGRKLVADHAEGYVVFAPAKNGNYIYRTKDWRRVVPGSRHDAAAVEARAGRTSTNLTAYLAARAAAGVRKIILPKATWRLSTASRLLIPSGLTLDLGGGKLKLNTTKVQYASPIRMFRTKDTHLVNGEIEGCYFEYDYENCGTKNPEHVGCFNLEGDAAFCSVENLFVHDTVSCGTSFGLSWLENADEKPQFEVREWGKRNAIVAFAGTKERKIGTKIIPAVNWERGRLASDGTVRDNGEGCFTSPVKRLGKLTKNRFLTVSRFLGYRGMSGVSDYFTIAFYDANGRFLRREVGFQYHRVLIPAKADTMRISIEADSLEKANACDLKAFMTAHPRHCSWRNVRYVRGRTQGLSLVDGFNMLFEDIDISFCGDESCRCASDAEDGWDGMQNFTFRNIVCHDNPNGDFTVCCGHSFVYENCTMRWWMCQRVHSPVVRNSTVKGGRWDALTRTRNGYTRFENNVYDCKTLTIGTPANLVKRKGVKPDWEVVLNGGVFRGTGEPMKLTAGETGYFRNCTFENVVKEGPADHYINCKEVTTP